MGLHVRLCGPVGEPQHIVVMRDGQEEIYVKKKLVKNTGDDAIRNFAARAGVIFLKPSPLYRLSGVIRNGGWRRLGT